MMNESAISQHLPPSVRNALVQAAQINADRPVSRERIEAIDEAADMARRMYPYLFVKAQPSPR